MLQGEGGIRLETLTPADVVLPDCCDGDSENDYGSFDLIDFVVSAYLSNWAIMIRQNASRLLHAGEISQLRSLLR